MKRRRTYVLEKAYAYWCLKNVISPFVAVLCNFERLRIFSKIPLKSRHHHSSVKMLHKYDPSCLLRIQIGPDVHFSRHGEGGGVGRSLNCHFPVPGNPSFCPMFVGSCLSAFFRLHKIAQCYVISLYSTLRNFPLFLPLSATLGIPLPATSAHVSRAPLALCPPGLPPLPPPLTGY